MVGDLPGDGYPVQHADASEGATIAITMGASPVLYVHATHLTVSRLVECAGMSAHRGARSIIYQ